MELFKHDDFNDCWCKDDIAYAANKKLNDYLASCPVVYGQGVEAMKSAIWCMNGPDFEVYRHTHKARLFGIEEIKKDCKHEPDWEEEGTGRPYCIHCNVELVAEWRAK